MNDPEACSVRAGRHAVHRSPSERLAWRSRGGRGGGPVAIARDGGFTALNPSVGFLESDWEAADGAEFRLNHVSLQVRSLDSSATFYQDVLLLPEIECGARKAHIRWFGLGNGQSIHLIEGDVGSTFVKRSTHFCISSPDFDRAVQHLRDVGAVYCNLAGEQGKQQTRADGVRSVYIQDPDGYWLEVNEDF